MRNIVSYISLLVTGYFLVVNTLPTACAHLFSFLFSAASPSFFRVLLHATRRSIFLLLFLILKSSSKCFLVRVEASTLPLAFGLQTTTLFTEVFYVPFSPGTPTLPPGLPSCSSPTCRCSCCHPRVHCHVAHHCHHHDDASLLLVAVIVLYVLVSMYLCIFVSCAA